MSEYIDYGPEDRAYDEARVEVLNELVKTLNKRKSVRARIQQWHDKIEQNHRIPPGFELVKLKD